MRLFKRTLIYISIFILNFVWSQWEYPGDVTLTGSEEIVFDYSADNCEEVNLPDAPTRAFRDANGKIQLIISHHESYRMIGDDFNSLSIDCDNGPVLSSHKDADPGNYNDNEWIGSLFTFDGATIYTMIHDEYHGFEHDGMCNSTEGMDCWYNVITFGVSTDTGKTYTHTAAPSHLLASVPYTYDIDAGPYGYFEPSNIIQNPNDGYYYMFVGANEGYGLQETGVCLMRTLDITDPTGWRGWDGENFNVALIDPYTETGFDPADHVMARIDGNLRTYGNIEKMHYSISYNTYFEKFMLVDAAQKGDVWGFYYSLSEDLLHWTPRKLIMEANVNINPNHSTNEDMESYPVLIDHSDTTRNFSQTGQTPYLYFTRYDQTSGSLYQRDLVRIPISFSKLLVDGFTVDRKGDSDDINIGDGICETSLGFCSFRAAIQEAYYRPEWYIDSVLTINFEIEVVSHTITPATPYFPARFPVIIDGTTQDTYIANSNDFNQGMNPTYGATISGEFGVITLEGGNSVVKGLSMTGLTLLNDSNTVIGNSIGSIRFENSSFNVIGGSDNADRNRIDYMVVSGSNSSHNVIHENYIGTDLDGTASSGSSEPGINISGGSSYNLIDGNLISGINHIGIEVADTGSIGNQILNNYIGVDRTGTQVLNNTGSGIKITGGTSGTIVGENGSGNIIGGNTGEAGIFIQDESGVTVQGNYIGTNPSGDNLGNTDAGIWLSGTSSDNMIGGTSIGEGNVIAYNGGAGISLLVMTGLGNSILGNSIYSNVGEGIGNITHVSFDTLELITALVWQDSVLISGTLNSSANSTFRIEFFKNSECDGSGYGEGKLYLGYTDITTDDSGSAIFSDRLAATVLSGQFITATATDAGNSTSGFSECQITFTSDEAPIITVTETEMSFDLQLEVTVSETKNFTIANSGTYDLEWSSNFEANWIGLEQDHGTLSTEQTVTIGVTADSRVGLSAGLYTDNIIIQSNDPSSPSDTISVSLTLLDAPGVPDLHISPDTVFTTLPPGDAYYTESFYIRNDGDSGLNWFSTKNQPWITDMSPAGGTLDNGDSTEISVDIRTNQLEEGEHIALLVIHANYTGGDNYPHEIPVIVTITGEGENISPVAFDQNETIRSGSSVTITLNGSDANNDPLYFPILEHPEHGTLTDDSDTLIVFNIFDLEAGPADVNYWMFDSDDTPFDYNSNESSNYAYVGFQWNVDGQGGSGVTTTFEAVSENMNNLDDMSGVEIIIDALQLSHFEHINLNNPDQPWDQMDDAGDLRIYSEGYSEIRVNGVTKLRVENISIRTKNYYPNPVGPGGANGFAEGFGLGHININASDINWVNEFDPGNTGMVEFNFESFSPTIQGFYGAYDVLNLSLKPISGNTVTYTPEPGFLGDDVFTFIAIDGIDFSNEAQVFITVKEANNAPVLADMQDININEDAFIEIPFLATDADGDDLNFSASSDTGAVVVSITDTSFILTPVENWFGDATISVSVSDGIDYDSASFVLSVIPVNDAPSGFQLASPAHAQSIVFTNNNLQDSLIFSWERSEDVEGDPIDYLYSSSGLLASLLNGTTSETTVSIGYADIQAAMDSVVMTATWDIAATDGTEDTPSDNGSFAIEFIDSTALGIEADIIPETFVLGQNYPNPFNPVTTIPYAIPIESQVILKIFDLSGREIVSLYSGIQTPGIKSVKWRGVDSKGNPVSAGVYFYRIQAGSFTQTKKLLLLK